MSLHLQPLPHAGGENIEERARRLVGARFRLHGRDPAGGLDCVGVVACATGRQAPSGYALRGGRTEDVAAVLRRAGFGQVARCMTGDIALAAVGPGQWHLLVLTRMGFVHADASLRRVVERPGPPPWRIDSVWRAEQGVEAWRRSS